MIIRDYIYMGEEGFHARPVTEFTRVAREFESRFTIRFDDEDFDGKSPFSIMSACIEGGNRFTLEIDGPDEQQADETLRVVMMDPSLSERLMDAPDSPATPEAVAGRPKDFPSAVPELCRPVGSKAPRSTEPGPPDACGAAASPGIAIGTAYVYNPARIDGVPAVCENPEAEKRAFEKAFERVRHALEDEQARAERTHAEILDAHIELLKDESLKKRVLERIAERRQTAAYALYTALSDMEIQFQSFKSERIRERFADIKDICMRIYAELTGVHAGLDVRTPHTVVVAEDLLPSDTLKLDKSLIAGFITELGARNSHSAILARAGGFPAVVGAGQNIRSIRSGDTVILDGDTGAIFVNPDPDTLRAYEQRIEARQAKKDMLRQYTHVPTRTADGIDIELSANLFAGGEIFEALQNGAEGVGLFRTEFLYMNRAVPPDLNEQCSIYKEVLKNAGGRPVTIRTLDAGGDKPLACLDMKAEANPFLGNRAIRYCLSHPDILRTQLKALLIASASGTLRIMFPMITLYDELQKVRAILEEEKHALLRAGTTLGEYQVGIMIETPSAALVSGDLAELCDFFSIGSNDLIQYVMAADRLNPELQLYCSHYHPSVLRAIYAVVQSALEKGVWVGVCGESAGDLLVAPLYVAMGITELSMAAQGIAECRMRLNALDAAGLKARIPEILSLKTAAEIKQALLSF